MPQKICKNVLIFNVLIKKNHQQYAEKILSQNANFYKRCVHENRGLKKIVCQSKQEHSLVLFEMLFFYGGINCISQIITLLALVETIQKHAKVFESTQHAVLPETSNLLPSPSRPLYAVPANWCFLKVLKCNAYPPRETKSHPAGNVNKLLRLVQN